MILIVIVIVIVTAIGIVRRFTGVHRLDYHIFIWLKLLDGIKSAVRFRDCGVNMAHIFIDVSVFSQTDVYMNILG